MSNERYTFLLVGWYEFEGLMSFVWLLFELEDFFFRELGKAVEVPNIF